ncbi:MAG: hypothetical protein V9E81_13305 [Marmoricola sp.]
MSRTVRVSTPSATIRSGMLRVTASLGVRLRVGFMPTRPQQEAGMRIDPPPSLACAMGTTPAATNAAAPAEEAPEV